MFVCLFVGWLIGWLVDSFILFLFVTHSLSLFPFYAQNGVLTIILLGREMTARNLTLLLELAVPHSLEARARDIAVFGTRDDLAVESDKFRLPSTRWTKVKSSSGRAMTHKGTLKKKESSMRGRARSGMLRSMNEASGGTFLDRKKGITGGRKGLKSVLSSRAPSSVAAGMLGLR